MPRGAVALLPLILCAVGCARFAPFLPDRPEAEGVHFISGFHHIQQYERGTCGSTCLLMVLRHWGATNLSQDDMARTFEPSNDGIAAGTLCDFANKIGMKAFLLSWSRAEIREHIDKGRPLIVLLPARIKGNHYYVLVGYTDRPEFYILDDPHEGLCKAPIEQFEQLHRQIGQLVLLVGKPK